MFAPHYAAPMPRVVLADSAALLPARGEDKALTILRRGDVFEVLELAGGKAWGVAPGPALVGYVDASALGETE